MSSKLTPMSPHDQTSRRCTRTFSTHPLELQAVGVAAACSWPWTCRRTNCTVTCTVEPPLAVWCIKQLHRHQVLRPRPSCPQAPSSTVTSQSESGLSLLIYLLLSTLDTSRPVVLYTTTSFLQCKIHGIFRYSELLSVHGNWYKVSQNTKKHTSEDVPFYTDTAVQCTENLNACKVYIIQLYLGILARVFLLSLLLQIKLLTYTRSVSYPQVK